MKITWALIVQRRAQHDRARELDDAQFRPVANRMRDFVEAYLEAPPGTVTMRVSGTNKRYGEIDLSFTGEQAGTDAIAERVSRMLLRPEP